MASRIFQDPALLSRVEAAVFPRVIGDFRRWKDSVPDGGSGFVIMESAIYLEKPVLAGPDCAVSAGDKSGESHDPLGSEQKPGAGADGQSVG